MHPADCTHLSLYPQPGKLTVISYFKMVALASHVILRFEHGAKAVCFRQEAVFAPGRHIGNTRWREILQFL